MAPMLDIKNERDYQKMIKMADAVGIEYSIPKEEKLETSVKDNSNFIYVPSIGLHVAKERTLFGKDFYETQEALHSNNQKMLTIPEFREFLKYTKENHKDIYDEITEIRSPWRSEWLDADFKTKGKKLAVNYHIFDSKGKIVKKSEVLDKNTLMEDKTPGISLDNWLEDSTKQGLPKNITKDGKTYFWYPRSDNDSVARFGADSVWSDLDCCRYPSDAYSYLGVRASSKLE